MKKIYSVIEGSGSYIPEVVVPNSDFLGNEFFYDYDKPITDKSNEEIVKKFRDISGIEERRYVTDDLVTSDIGSFAAEKALEGIDREDIDYIIFAHNFGDIRSDNLRTDMVPSLAARVKNRLGIKNPKTIPYDLPFGCPGWVQGIVQANYFIKSGDAKKILVIGAETLSRVSDSHDRDGMLYSDGAGAVEIEAVESDKPIGILSHSVRSDTGILDYSIRSKSSAFEHLNLLKMGKSYNPNYKDNRLFIKMNGHMLFEYALNMVPGVVKESLEKSGVGLSDIKKILMHQANDKLDKGILKGFFRLFGIKRIRDIPEDIMPMTISWLGNSSVATVPTLYDLLIKGELKNHQLNSGDNTIFTSVGAGMGENSVVYRMP